jgi:hypothetical protein
MEKIVNKRIEEYTRQFKDDIKDKIVSLHFCDNERKNDLLEFIYGYEKLTFDKKDVSKPKRTKIDLPFTCRCIAKRVNGEQCSRRKKNESEYCGTHIKSIPYGIFETEEDNIESKENLSVFAEDIQGIIYYIDKFLNVYNTEHIVEGIENPKIIAKAHKINGVYTIPQLGLV